MRKLYKYILPSLLGIVLLALMYCCLYYPQQSMPIGVAVFVETPEYDKYRNDCLHPYIRYDKDENIYHMAQSPYYGWNNKVENPMYYMSYSYDKWSNGVLLSETPMKGCNSDPSILLNNDTVIYVWRECMTPRCDSLNVVQATVGGMLQNGKIENVQVYTTNTSYDYDVQQCPILFENICVDSFYIYAAWYQYEPNRIGKGIAIWRGKNIVKPDFQLIDTLTIQSVYTVDKYAQMRMFNYIWYIPVPLKHDIWHFDLFEYDNKLYMVSVAEKGDNIMLSVSHDYLHFKTYRKPLVNNHYSENYTGYRQYFYKPTAFVKNDSLFVFYTANAKDDPNRNQLFVTAKKMEEIIQSHAF